MEWLFLVHRYSTEKGWFVRIGYLVEFGIECKVSLEACEFASVSVSMRDYLDRHYGKSRKYIPFIL